MNDNLPSNSDRSKENRERDYSRPEQTQEKERPTPKAVASGTKKAKKKGVLKRVKNFLFEDELDAPSFNISDDIIKPNIKNTFLDILSAITGGIVDSFESALFKDSYSRGRRSRRSRRGRDSEYRNGYIDYSAPSSKSRGSEDKRSRRELTREAREMQDFSDVTYYTDDEYTALEKAENVKEGLKELISVYGNARVSDFFALSGFTPSHQDKKWGWYDLSLSRPERTGDGGYYLVLPKPVLLKST